MATIRSSVLMQAVASLKEGQDSSLGKAQPCTLRIPGRLSSFEHAKPLRAAFKTGRGRIVHASSSQSVSTRSEEQARLIKESWKMLKKDAAKHALAFFLKVFEIAPTVKQLFSFMRDSPVPAEQNPHLKAHALVVFMMTGEAAVVLGEDPTLSSLRPKLVEMGQTHVVHHVVDEHFDVVKYALLETLKDALQEKWTPELKAAWAEAYDAITCVIKDEMHSLRARSP